MKFNEEVTPWSYQQNVREEDQQKMLITTQGNSSNFVTYESVETAQLHVSQHHHNASAVHKPPLVQLFPFELSSNRPKRRNMQMKNINVSSLLDLGSKSTIQVASKKIQYQKLLLKQILLVYIHEELRNQKKQQREEKWRQKLGCLFPLIENKNKHFQKVGHKKGSLNDIIYKHF